MASINPYIHFNGNAEEAFTFYRSVFGGNFSTVKRYKDLPAGSHAPAEHEANKILHIALPLGPAQQLLGSDVPEMLGRVNEKDNRNTIFLQAASQQEAEALFQGLSDGGEVEMPLGEGPWGSHFAMVTDRFGVEWMIEYQPAN